MEKSIQTLKGGTADLEGTVKAGLEVLLSKYELQHDDFVTNCVSVLKNSIKSSVSCEYNPLSLISLAVVLLKPNYSYKKMAELLQIPISRIRRAIAHGQKNFPGAMALKQKKMSSIRTAKQRQIAFANFLSNESISYEAPATRVNRMRKTTKILINSRKGKNH